MKIIEILNNISLLEQLNNNIRRYTNFRDFEDLTDPKYNFRLVFRIELETPNLERMELNTIADYYDEYMISINDPRRIYRQD
jgi:hypothetical protein